MVALNTPVCEFGKGAVDFELPDCNGKHWSLQECKGEHGLLVMFICNHCPYVQSILPELVATTENLKSQGVNSVAIMSNDWDNYPDDSPSKMLELKNKFDFSFPYLIDESQEVAKAYGAVCTPDFFGYNKNLELQYRGRFDSRGMNKDELHSENELEQAMLMVAATGLGPKEQVPSIGCSIKWRS
jgi:peroxiredoxin